MFTTRRPVASFIMLGMLIAALSACEKKETAADGKGPAERTGQQIDQATVRAGEELNKAAENTGKGLQEMGKKLQNEAEEAQKKE